MMRRQDGFTLVELMVALVVFVFAMAAATAIFIPLVNEFKQQSKIAETNIEGLVGLELMKADLEQAGYGLPWCFLNNMTYTETNATPANALNDATSNPPRGVAAGDNVTYNGAVNGNANVTGIANLSDYLVIRSVLVSGTDATRKWSYIIAQNATNTRVWDNPYPTIPDLNNPSSNDYVIVINPTTSSPCTATCPMNCLVMNGTAATFAAGGFTQYSSTAFPTAFSPAQPTLNPNQTFLIFDIASQAGTAGTDLTGPLTMPFNRADYFVGIPSASTKPTRCASNTGVLYKAVLNQDDTFHPNDMLPLLDCVADMQVIFGLDINGDGVIDTYSNANGNTAVDATPITGQGLGLGPQAAGILMSQSNLTQYRSAVKEVRIYILAHEGQMDQNYTYTYNNPFSANPCGAGSNTLILVGNPLIGTAVGHCFDLTTIPNYQHYRWKVYAMVVKLLNINEQ